MAPYFTAALIEIFMQAPLMKLNPRCVEQAAARARGDQEAGSFNNNNNDHNHSHNNNTLEASWKLFKWCENYKIRLPFWQDCSRMRLF